MDKNLMIQVGPIRYTLDASPETMAKYRADWREPDGTGFIDHRNALIAVDTSRAPDCVARTIMHEVLHSVIEVAECEHLTGSDERFVGAVAGLLLDTLRRNPGLVPLLLGEK